MNLYSLNTVAIALIAVGLIIPTGAVAFDGGDKVWDDHGIVLSPHDSPNGQTYAEINSEGNLSIDLATVGVNPDALTTVRNLFDVTNNGETTLEVWFAHEANESVHFSVAEHGPLYGEENAIRLEPGEGRTVDLLINTNGREATSEPLLTSFEVHVDDVETGGTETPTPTPTPTPSPTPSPTPTEAPTSGSGGQTKPTPMATPRTPQPTPQGTPDPRVEDVEVIFEDDPAQPVTIQEVPVEQVLDEETDPDDRREPRVVIDIQRSAGGEQTQQDERQPPERAFETVVEANEVVTLTGTRSVVGSVRSVDQDRRIVKAVDINVPPGRENTPATVRMRVNAERFESEDLNPTIAHETDDGWQMLDTRIVGQQGGQLLLEARTPGFSRFAVFARPAVTYTWRLGGEVVTAKELRTRFDEPGYHNVTLNVTDALGRTSSATYRVLVNDKPSVAIDVPANRSAGEPITLRANVTNEVGNATVTWLFPDDSQQEGLTARYTFERGDQPVRVTVQDEYGASTTVQRTISFGPVSAADVVIQRIAGGVPFDLALGLVALVSFLVAILLRRVLSRDGLRVPSPSILVPSFRSSIGGLPTTGSDPRIVSFEDPTVDVFNRRFQIGHLRIEDPGGDLRTVEIVVTDSRGNEVAQKTVDLRGQSHYETRSEVVLPKSRVYVREDDEYEISVRAGDATDAWVRRSHSSIRAPGAIGA